MKSVLLLLIFLFSISVHGYEITYFTIKDSATPLQIGGSLARDGGVITEILWDILKKRPDISVNSQELPFVRMDRAMRKGTYKNWINYGAKNWKGPQSLNLSSTSIFTARNQFLSLKGYKVLKASDLFNKRIVLICGFDYPGLQRYIDEGKIQVVWVDDYLRAITAVKLERGVGFVGMDLRIMYNLRKLGYDSTSFEFNDFSQVIPNYNIHFAFSQSFPPDLFKYIDRELKKMKLNGDIDKIWHKYMFTQK